MQSGTRTGGSPIIRAVLEILSLPFTNGAVALERPTLVLEAEPGTPGAPTKGVRSHSARV